VRLEIHNNLAQVTIVEATRVLVLDNLGNPIAFALLYLRDPTTGREHLRVGHAGDKDFENQLALNGIKKTVLVEHIDLTPKDKQ
jgi:hypothetical protein